MHMRLTLILTLAATAAACGESRPAKSDHGGRRDVAGEPVSAGATGEGIWGGDVRLVEELSIGMIDGPVEYLFADVTAIVPDGAGGIYVYDRQVPALRNYDRDGHFRRTIGGKGEGPGEYSDAVVGMAVVPDGRLLVYDVRNSRINLYDAHGNATDHWPVHISMGLFMGRQLLTDSAGHAYLKILTGELRWPVPSPWPIGLLHMDDTGRVVDTIPPPLHSREPSSSPGPLDPRKVWEMHPRLTVVGVNDCYEFEIRRRDGPTVAVSKEFDPLAVTGQEWKAYEAQREWEAESEGSETPPTPRTKPAYRGFRVGEDGRIWVLKYMPTEFQKMKSDVGSGGRPAFPFVEPVGFDVFEIDGTYLGEIVAPPDTEVHWIGTNTLLGVRHGELDEQYVVRLRLLTED